MLACEVFISCKENYPEVSCFIGENIRTKYGMRPETIFTGKNTPCSVLSACLAHQAMLKSLAVNVRRQKGNIQKISKVYVNIEDNI